MPLATSLRAKKIGSDSKIYGGERRTLALRSGHSLSFAKTLVFDEVVPALREMGVMDDAAFETIFVDNPRRLLVGE